MAFKTGGFKTKLIHWLGGYTKDDLAKHCDSVPVMSCIFRAKIKKEMKKAMLLALTTLMMVGCGNPTPTNKVNNKVNKTPNKYEVLLSTKDTIYVEAYYYTSYAGFFGNSPIETITFYDRNHDFLQEINNPVYVKEIRTK